jgi:Domain of unknown function (DUF3391)
MKKSISIDQLTPGMYVVDMDRSWLDTPFWSHRFLIKEPSEAISLKDHGVRVVVIDTSLGRDVDAPSTRDSQLAASTTAGETPSPPAPPLPTFSERDVQEAKAARTDALTSMQRVFDGIKTGNPLNGTAVRTVVNSLIEHLLARERVMLTLIQFQQMRRSGRDPLAHAVDVCVLALILGHLRNLDTQRLEWLGMGALLHDVGETRLPQNLLARQATPCCKMRRMSLQPSSGSWASTTSGWTDRVIPTG